jgi:hypothetical protein
MSDRVLDDCPEEYTPLMVVDLLRENAEEDEEYETAYDEDECTPLVVMYIGYE